MTCVILHLFDMNCIRFFDFVCFC